MESTNLVGAYFGVGGGADHSNSEDESSRRTSSGDIHDHAATPRYCEHLRTLLSRLPLQPNRVAMVQPGGSGVVVPRSPCERRSRRTERFRMGTIHLPEKGPEAERDLRASNQRQDAHSNLHSPAPGSEAHRHRSESNLRMVRVGAKKTSGDRRGYVGSIDPLRLTAE